MLDLVYNSIKTALERSGYRLAVGEITLDFLEFQFTADQKKYSNPELDPTLHDLDENNSFWIEIKDKSNDTVATMASRLHRIESLFSLCEYHRFWYGEKIRILEPLNIVYTDQDRMPQGTASYDGALWVRPDHRNRGLSWALCRLCRLTAIRMWKPEWIFAFGFQGVARAGLLTTIYGYPRYGKFATGFKFPGYPGQPIYLATMTAAEVIRDAADDWHFLTSRPNLVLDQAFADDLRERRRREAAAEQAA